MLVVSHDVVIMSFRYVVEQLDEQTILEIARATPLFNASVTRYGLDAWGTRRLVAFNDVRHLGSGNADVTRHPGDRHRAT